MKSKSTPYFTLPATFTTFPCAWFYLQFVCQCKQTPRAVTSLGSSYVSTPLNVQHSGTNSVLFGHYLPIISTLLYRHHSTSALQRHFLRIPSGLPLFWLGLFVVLL